MTTNTTLNKIKEKTLKGDRGQRNGEERKNLSQTLKLNFDVSPLSVKAWSPLSWILLNSSPPSMLKQRKQTPHFILAERTKLTPDCASI